MSKLRNSGLYLLVLLLLFLAIANLSMLQSPAITTLHILP